MAHLQSGTIENYALRHLPATQTASAEEHLLLCQSCGDRLDEVEIFREAVSKAFDQHGILLAT